jgi:uncharacterized protein YndB with AHSA1/START domain
MVDMHHSVKIEAPIGKVYSAITTEDGLKNWWTRDVKINSSDKTIVLGFNNHTAILKMRINNHVPDRSINWTCLGNAEEWKDTELSFELQSTENGTTLSFSHSKWRMISPYYEMVNRTWGQLMVLLKQYCEGKKDGSFNWS